jgi:hypothetical protein
MRRVSSAVIAANLCLWAACASSDDPNLDDAAPPTSPAPAAHELRGGRVHAVTIGSGGAIAAARADLHGQLSAIAASDLAEVHRHVAPARGGAQLTFVTLRQTVAGVPIDDTYLHLTTRADGQSTRLVGSSYHLFAPAHLDTRPAITEADARARAAQGLRLAGTAEPIDHQLVIHQLEGQLQLAWSFTFPDTPRRAFVIASGAGAGRVLTVDTRQFAEAGRLVGQVVRGGAPGGLGVAQTIAIPNATITGASQAATTDAGGNFLLDIAAGKPIKGALSGRASIVTDERSANLLAKGTAGAAAPLAFDAGNADHLAQVTAYYIVDQVRAFLEANGMDAAGFGPPLSTITNEPDTCNAFYCPVGRTVNFFRAGGGCNNSAIDTVIAHEYGHFVDDLNGGIEDGGLSEGWGDTLACLWSKQPHVGDDLFPGQPGRSCQNAYVYPASGIDEVHSLGQAWSGFVWDVRTSLSARLGADAGDQLTRALILPSFQSNAPDIPTAVREVFLRDDDNGDLSDHTPHWDVLRAAADRHGLGFVVETDVIPPSPVADLAVTHTDATQLTVRWTAPGDDHEVGTAARYELRWSTQPITADNFAAATLVATAAPRPTGSAETATFTVAPSSTVYVAMIAIDDNANAAPLSNVASTTTPAGTVVFADGAETAAATTGWTMTGLWHVTARKAAEGTHAFWYGQEATGNYDTPGKPNSGDLTSPAIDLTAAIAPVLVLAQYIHVELDPLDLATITIQDLADPSHSLSLAKDVAFSNGVFAPRVIPLVGFAGKRIQLRFHFDTVDYIGNQTDGWFVDRLQIIGSAASH